MEQTTSKNEVEAIHQIPSSLHEFRDSLPGALYYLALGKRPTAIPVGEAKSMRFLLHPDSVIRCEKLMLEFGSRTKIIIAALAWVAEQDQRAQLLLKHMKPYR